MEDHQPILPRPYIACDRPLPHDPPKQPSSDAHLSHKEVFGLLCDEFGFVPVHPDGSRDVVLCRRVGKMAKMLAAKQITKEQFDDRIAAYQREWPTVALTADALIKQWEYFSLEQRAKRAGGAVIPAASATDISRNPSLIEDARRARHAREAAKPARQAAAD